MTVSHVGRQPSVSLTRFGHVLLLLSLASLLAQAAEPPRSYDATLQNLPPLPPVADVDWLIERPAQRAGVFRGERPNELVLDNGLVRRVFCLAPNLGCVELQQRVSGESLLRAVRPECQITLDGVTYDVGGLTGQPIENFLSPDWYRQLTSSPTAFQWSGLEVRPTEPRFAWKKRSAWMGQDLPWPAPGIHVIFQFRPPADSKVAGLVMDVHYELYDGMPLFAKWFTLKNQSDRTVRVDGFVSEKLACVEAGSQVEDIVTPLYPNLYVETDFTSCAMDGASSQRETVHWLPDAQYATQVNYRLQTPCTLECRPPLGPHVTVPPQGEFNSFRTWELLHDRRDATRMSLALARMYRTIAPWVTENPLIHHVRSAQPDAVRLAIDQSAEVGFELVIMTFGSGFNLEDNSAGSIAQIRELADFAHRKGIALGGYSLLASRSIDSRNDVINPATGQPGGFARFGNSPCIESEWGQEYVRKLYAFYEQTGCDVLEHDGSYPGDACASHDHPGHEGWEDSRWRQWQTITQFYQWSRGQGIYLNVPDWYFLHGSNKTGMGYRETNWSLPREQQEIIERQNIHDGTRYKTPTMGWMFVPLTEYHGGGAAATIEPLSEHLDHYERRLQNLLGAGVQACYRGPRIYDTDQTKQVVKRWVDFYRQHRVILDSDLIPLRRADGRDWDGWLHVHPGAPIPAMAWVYNPLAEPITRTIRVPLYYAGLTVRAEAEVQESAAVPIELDRMEQARLTLTIPARGCRWIIFRPSTP